MQLVVSAATAGRQAAGKGGGSGQKRALALTVAPGLLLWLLPAPAGVSSQAWHLTAIFVSMLVGIVLQPLPLGAVALCALCATLATRTLTVQQALAGFAAEVPHLILAALFLARAFSASGLGRRLALAAVATFGSSPLGLAYSLVFSEALLAPAIPSVVARSAGILLPIATSLARAAEGGRAGGATQNGDDEGGARGEGSGEVEGGGAPLGAYLLVTLFQTSAVSSAMFLTANHPNPLTAALVEAATGVRVTWALWARAAVLPGLVSLLALPLLLAALMRPQGGGSAGAQEAAATQLRELGAVSRDEIVMGGVMAAAVGLWMAGGALGLSPLTVALCALCALLLLRVVSWEQCLATGGAWNTLTWFSVVLALATQLRACGVVEALTSRLAAGLTALGLPWQASFGLTLTAYFYSHYFFASNLAHVSAMFAAFLGIAIAAGTPPLLAGLAFAFSSNMMGGLTQYGMSHGPAYFGEGYVSVGRWWQLGLACSIANIAVWALVGTGWWKVLGIW